MKLRRVAMLALACAAGLALPSMSSAGTIIDWENGGPVSVGDKTFTFVSETGVGQTTAAFNQVVTGFYTLQLSDFKDDSGTSLASSWTGELKYDVLVTNPSNTFLNATIDSTHVGSGVDISKTISSASFSTFTITSVDGAIASHAISGMLIHVDEVFTVGANGAIINATNAVTQQGPGIPSTVPEPGSLMVLALGLGTIGVFGWMKRRQAAAV